MTELVTSLFTGISSASLLFLVAAGFTLIFGALRVINIAHGSFYLIGGYFLYELTGRFDIPVWIGVPLAAVGVLVLSLLIERLIIRYTYDKEHLFQLLATYALTLVLADAVLMAWGNTARSVESPIPGTWSVLGMDLPAYRFVVIAVAVVVGVGLWLLLSKTRLGWMIRGSSENPATLQALGYNVPRLNALVFGMGGALAGLAGAVYAPMGSLAPGLDSAILVEVFVITIVGGLGSILGAAITALIIGVLKGVVILVAPELSSSLIYIIMIVMMIIRPWGLFGKPER